MITIGCNGEEVKSPDLTKGRLVSMKRIKPSAVGTIDDVVKFAYSDDDYEDVMVYIPFTQEDIAKQEAAKKAEEEQKKLEEALARAEQSAKEVTALQVALTEVYEAVLAGGEV